MTDCRLATKQELTPIQTLRHAYSGTDPCHRRPGAPAVSTCVLAFLCDSELELSSHSCFPSGFADCFVAGEYLFESG
jgi:hypothetical protein